MESGGRGELDELGKLGDFEMLELGNCCDEAKGLCGHKF